ncbi:Ctr copper transporter [Exidia glandulosa HHB12029]|uniref:Copper transport protein n=1 Tax=Exidia glandulosa HHB12029 TaxID=1314781 RepID=A0A166AT00_EXIGL|nr:Ctr copper transporter [Exidia glandulosa HHB12029]
MASSLSDTAVIESAGMCKISMLWNWFTVDSCFISKSWHVRSAAGFAGTVLAVFMLVVVIELVRRAGREYDRHIASAGNGAPASLGLQLPPSPFHPATSTAELLPLPATASGTGIHKFRQAVRSTLYMVQYSAGLLLMLIAMSYNGYIIIFGIFAGSWAGHFVSSWDTVATADTTLKDNCC